MNHIQSSTESGGLCEVGRVWRCSCPFRATAMPRCGDWTGRIMPAIPSPA